VIAKQALLRRMSKLERIALIKERYRKLVLDARDESETELIMHFDEDDIADVEEDDLTYETN